MFRVESGDCLEKLKSLENNSIDSIVTDPPYGLSFMGKKWDYDVPSVEIWKECLRVLKPGGHLLAFGGTRTYHRLVVNIEDAGFEIRDQIQWLYGSGFPKSMDISKAIDKQAGAEREVLGLNPSQVGRKTSNIKSFVNTVEMEGSGEVVGQREAFITAPATPEAKQWQGWGTALKPANEPICVARKPLEAKLTVAANVLKYGTGGLNIDASRIGSSGATKKINTESCRDSLGKYGNGLNGGTVSQLDGVGRWPANIILDEEASVALDIQTQDNVSRFFKVVPCEPNNVSIAEMISRLLKQLEDFAANLVAISGNLEVELFEDTRIPSILEILKESNKSGETDTQTMLNIEQRLRLELGHIKMLLNGHVNHVEIQKQTDTIMTTLNHLKSIFSVEVVTSKTTETNLEVGERGFASRFAYVAKASKRERGEGNVHPTVKPVKLMEYLIKLVTPVGGTVLDPFCGSGTTGIAAVKNDFKFFGIEREQEYVTISISRIGAAKIVSDALAEASDDSEEVASA